MHEGSQIAAEVFLEQHSQILTDQSRSLPPEHGGGGIIYRKDVRTFIEREDRNNLGGCEAVPIAKLVDDHASA